MKNDTWPVTIGFIESHPIDAARIVESFADDAVGRFVEELPAPLAATLVTVMDIGVVSRVLESIDVGKSSAIVQNMSAAAGLGTLHRLSDRTRSAILAGLTDELRSSYEKRLRYPRKSAAGFMDPTFPCIFADITAQQALDRVKRLPQGIIYHVFVVDRQWKLLGFVTVRQLVSANSEDRVESVLRPIRGTLRPDMSFAAVVAIEDWKEYPVLPVVDNNNVFLGAITYRTLRLLEEAEQSTRRTDVDTGTALGELYWYGLVGLYRGTVAALYSGKPNKNV